MSNAGFTFCTPSISKENLTVYNVRNAPFRLHGLYRPETPGLFCRMPRSVAERTSPKVTSLFTNPSGARIQFRTDSAYIAVGAVYPEMSFSSPRTAALAGAGAFCFDLYADQEFYWLLTPESLRQDGSVMHFHLEDGHYEAGFRFPEKKMRQITLNFPSFVNVADVFIGLEAGSQVLESLPYRYEKPVVFYGSSITQGGCASRPGNLYQNILSRRLNFDYLNLGFAGACKAEDAIVEYLCSLDMSMLVFDYDHNSPNPEFLEKTHFPALEKFRHAQPDTPIVLLSRPNQSCSTEDLRRRREIIRQSQEKCLSMGAQNVHFVDGQTIFSRYDGNMVTIDGTHPTDFGFFCIADALEPVMRPYFPD